MGRVEASLNYLAPSITSSLYRTGGPMMRRDGSGSDSGLEGVEIVRERVPLSDGRGDGIDCTLDQHGFALIDAPLGDPGLDFLSADAVVEGYYAECAELVRGSTGAADVYAFDHNVRSADAKRSGHRIEGGQEVQGPARVVHGDYTLTSARQRLLDLARPPTDNDTYVGLLGDHEALVRRDRVDAAIEGGRFAMINVWRNIEAVPVASDPIVLCDARSVEPEDLVVFEIHYGDRIGENYWSKHSPRHAWYTFPAIERHEALLIKQWDSAGAFACTEGRLGDAQEPGAPSTFSFHTAYFDKSTMGDAPPRWSIEVRCLALYA